MTCSGGLTAEKYDINDGDGVTGGRGFTRATVGSPTKF